MKITDLSLWNDIGFQENTVEVPSVDDTLPFADFKFQDLHPSKSDVFSVLKIPQEYLPLQNVSYLLLQVQYSTGRAFDYYGWVDSVSPQADSEYPVTVIRWHIDLWRTYLRDAKFGYGLVTGRPRGTSDPLQKCSYRYRLAGDYTPIDPDGMTINWLLFTYVEEEDDKTTAVRTCALPLDRDNPNVSYKLRLDGSDTEVSAPTLSDIAQGRLSDVLGISASQITSAFISPVCPFSATRRDTTVTFATYGGESVSEKLTTQFNDDKVPHLTTLIYEYGAGKHNIVWEDSEGGNGYEVFDDIDSLGGYLHTLNGPDERTKCYGISYNTSYHRVDLSTLMSIVAPDVSFVNGDKVHLDSVTGGLTCYTELDGTTVKHVISWPTEQSEEYVYSDGWPKVDLYSQSAFTGYYTYERDSMQYSVSLGDHHVFTTSQNLFVYDFTAEGVQTDDLREWMLTDMNGVPVGSVPWGMDCSNVTVRNVVSSTSAYLQIRADGVDSNSEGLEFNVPLPAVDVCSNSWSDYVYSGQRENDIYQRNVAAQQALLSGVTGGLMGGVSNGVMSKASTGGFSAGIGLASAGLGIAGSVGSYALQQFWNGQLQNAQDQLAAKQFDHITSAGGGWDWLWHGRKVAWVNLIPDDYSLQRFTEDISLNGIQCSEPTRDCSELVAAGGPLRISGCIVTGDIPVEARNHFTTRLEGGVRIVTRNTEE